MLMYTPITPAGRPAMVARAAKEAMAPPGIPGVPTDRSTLARRITIIMEMLTLIPQAFAKNMIIKDMRMETASMFTVAPRGMAILVILLETPISSSMHCLLIGMVAELEQVPNAFNAAGSIALKNFTGLSLPMNLTAPPYTIKANPKNARYRITSWVASEIIVAVISMDDIDIAQYISPMLTTMHIPIEEMGRMTAKLLIDRINNGHTLPMKLSLPYYLAKRESCP